MMSMTIGSTRSAFSAIPAASCDRLKADEKVRHRRRAVGEDRERQRREEQVPRVDEPAPVAAVSRRRRHARRLADSRCASALRETEASTPIAARMTRP